MKYDFDPLLDASPSDLRVELSATITELANLYTDVAFLKSQEVRGEVNQKAERIQREGDVQALTEKKWLILRLLDLARDASPQLR